MYKNLGNILQSARQSKNVDMAYVSEILKIKEAYIRAIEAGKSQDTLNKSEMVYFHGAIKSYANWLGLNGDALLAQYKKTAEPLSEPLTVWDVFFKNAYFLMFIPNIKMYMVGIAAFFSIYGTWHVLQSGAEIRPLYHPGIEALFVEDKLKRFEEKILILEAKKNVRVRMQDGTEIPLQKGALFYMLYQKGWKPLADHPEDVIVHVDDAKRTVLGNMDDVFGRFELPQ